MLKKRTVTKDEPKAAPLAVAASPTYVFGTDAEEEARDAALREVAWLAGRVDDAIHRIDSDDAVHLEHLLLRTTVAPYLAEAPALDEALSAFFASSAEADEKENHVPTIGLWALAAVGRVYTGHVMTTKRSGRASPSRRRATLRRCARRSTRIARAPSTRGARFMRRAGARLEELLEEHGGCNAHTWLRPARP
jgi:hypothetical protein